MHYRSCTSVDAPLLAPLNLQLIRDAGERDTLDVAQLAERMGSWLQAGYEAFLFEDGDEAAGYVLFKREADIVTLRQLFVIAQRRRQGVARQALGWLWQNAWTGATALRVEILIGNAAGQAFWRAIGFVDYGLIMEASGPAAVEES
jgi:predicted acetyltransferase